MKQPPNKRFYSPKEAGVVLGLSESTIRRRIRDGSIGSVRIGASIRIHYGVIDELAAKSTAALEASTARRARARLRVMREVKP